MKTNTSLTRFAALLALCFGIILGSPASLLAQATSDVTYTPIGKTEFVSIAGEPATVWWAGGRTEGSQMKLGYSYDNPEREVSDFGFYWPGGAPTHVELHYNNGILSYSKSSDNGFLNATTEIPLNINTSRKLVWGAENTSSLSGDCIILQNLQVNGIMFPDATVNIGEFKGGEIEFTSSMPPVFDIKADVTLHTANGAWPRGFKFDFVAQSVPEPATGTLLVFGSFAFILLRGRRAN